MEEQGLMVVVMDNYSTYKSNALHKLIEDQGMYFSLSCLLVVYDPKLLCTRL